jgi:hypothetical protein
MFIIENAIKRGVENVFDSVVIVFDCNDRVDHVDAYLVPLEGISIIFMGLDRVEDAEKSINLVGAYGEAEEYKNVGIVSDTKFLKECEFVKLVSNGR